MSSSLFPPDRLVLIAGPCVTEDAALTEEIAVTCRDEAARRELPFIFKASFDKANRTALGSYRGPGLDQGLAQLAGIRQRAGVRLLVDIHEPGQAAPAAAVADVLQIPAFLCRQTDLLLAAGRAGKPVNIKKGQFVAPEDMRWAVEKVRSTGNQAVSLTERGASFGYHNLVVDMRALVIMADLGVPVLFDATHSVQLPGAGQGVTGGQRQFIFPLARAAVAVGVSGLYCEVHPRPDQAKSDGPNSLDYDGLRRLLDQVCALDRARRAG